MVLGKGITFPFILDPRGSIPLDDYETLIEKSINTIIGWATSSRPFLPPFGSRIWETIGEPNDDITLSLVKLFVIEAINTWEDRISLLEVTINKPEMHLLELTLAYVINATREVKGFNSIYVIP